MELYQLRSFAAVAEAGHLTRAAEQLHVSQPAVSAQIKALEDELGVALFDRVSSGMVLTSAGRRLLPEARKVMSAAQTLRIRARGLAHAVAGRVRVGSVSDPEFTRVGDFLANALDAHPLLEIEVHHEVSGTAFAKVREGTLDASFYYCSLVHADIVGIPLVEFAYRIVAPAAWRDAIVTAGTHPEWFKSMVTWSSVGDMTKDFIEDLGQEAFDTAEIIYTAALKVGDKPAEAHERLIRLFERLGDDEQAQGHRELLKQLEQGVAPTAETSQVQ